MPKYRKLHVTSIHSLDIAEMPDDFHRLMWTWLPLISCAEGRGLDMGSWLRGQIFSLRTDVSPQMCDEAMSWFAQRGMIQRYNINGRHYYQIVNWHKYQGDTSREADSTWPAPPQEQVTQGNQTYSRVSHEQVTSRSRSDAYAYAKAKAKVDAAASTDGANAPDAAAAAFMELWGFFDSPQARQLAAMDLPSDYIQAHLDHAKRNGEKTGLAIRRMIDGDPAPKTRPTIQDQVPIEYRDIIKQ